MELVRTQLVVAPGLNNVIQIAGGDFSAWSLQNDGTVLTWGLGATWAFEYPSSGVVALAGSGDNSSSADDYSLMLFGNGGVIAAFTPGNEFSQFVPFIPTGLSNVVAISAGRAHAVALENDGTPRVATPLPNQIVYSSSTVEFFSSIVSGLPLNYQWQFNGASLAGATNALLVLTNVPLSAAGSYTCIAANSFGAATNLATLTVLRSTPQFLGPSSFSTAGFTLQVDQLSGHGPIIILTSTNLVDWVPLFTNPPVTGQMEFLDPEATNPSRRFYQAVEQ